MGMRCGRLSEVHWLGEKPEANRSKSALARGDQVTVLELVGKESLVVGDGVHSLYEARDAFAFCDVPTRT